MHKKGNYSYYYTSVVYHIICKNQTSFSQERPPRKKNSQPTNKQLITQTTRLVYKSSVSVQKTKTGSFSVFKRKNFEFTFLFNIPYLLFLAGLSERRATPAFVHQQTIQPHFNTCYSFRYFPENTVAYWSNRKHRDTQNHFLFPAT